MKRLCRAAIGLMVLFTAIFGLWACTPRPYIPLTYRPAGLQSPLPLAVSIKFEDRRHDKQILGPFAKEKLPHFTGSFMLTISENDRKVRFGAQNLASLFENALRYRVEGAGALVSDLPKKESVKLRFQLNAFQMRAIGGLWKLRIAYAAEVVGAQGATAVQAVDASGQRQRLGVAESAEKLVGEVFTDAVNRLDIAALLRKAGIQTAHPEAVQLTTSL